MPPPAGIVLNTPCAKKLSDTFLTEEKQATSKDEETQIEEGHLEYVERTTVRDEDFKVFY